MRRSCCCDIFNCLSCCFPNGISCCFPTYYPDNRPEVNIFIDEEFIENRVKRAADKYANKFSKDYSKKYSEHYALNYVETFLNNHYDQLTKNKSEVNPETCYSES